MSCDGRPSRAVRGPLHVDIVRLIGVDLGILSLVTLIGVTLIIVSKVSGPGLLSVSQEQVNASILPP